ncbi:hypothetical protein HID58_077915 [Brassica napus]|uniref:Uncharacterized protein n=1 Tax=Brassica napus TaxID=3708 RepID=A0ABQ7YRY8_BRANA|nr:hypothetical protein HID58_077915 [Brassica napus]
MIIVDFAGSCLREAVASLAPSSSASVSYLTILCGGESDLLDRSQRSIPLYRSGGLLTDVGFDSVLNGCSSMSCLPSSLDVFVFRWSEFRGRIVVGVEASLTRVSSFLSCRLYRKGSCCLEKLWAATHGPPLSFAFGPTVCIVGPFQSSPSLGSLL